MTRGRGSMLGLGQVAKPYRKMFVPRGMDIWDQRALVGEPIKVGTVVKVTAHYGPFRVIEVRDKDGDLVSEASVGRGSLVPVPKDLEAKRQEAINKAFTYRYWFSVVRYEDGMLAVMHQNDVDKTLAQHPGLFVVLFTVDRTARLEQKRQEKEEKKR